jgi:transposase
MEVLGFVTDDLREWRRLQAVALQRRGWVQRDIADALGASEVSVSRWLARAREHGPHALLARRAPGPAPRLTAAQVARIPEFLWHGPEAYGFRGRVWTRKRIARVIEEEFDVRYHPGHVGRLLAELGWTPQMPIRRASQRDESAIRWWRDVTWPELRRQARRERRVLVFVDEAGFYLLPGVVKTYAPEGRTPVLRAKLARDHLSVMGGMAPAGKVYTLVRQEPLDGLAAVEFLAHLQRVAGKRLLVIWDGSPIHRRSAVTEFAEGTRGRVRVEALPGYAPDLNPWDEGGWHRLKNAELRNLACRDLEELHEEFHLAIARLRRKPELVQAFFAQAGLTLSH